MTQKLLILFFLVGGFTVSGESERCRPEGDVSSWSDNLVDICRKVSTAEPCSDNTGCASNNSGLSIKALEEKLKRELKDSKCSSLIKAMDEAGKGVDPVCKGFNTIDRCIEKFGCDSEDVFDDDEDFSNEDDELCKNHDKEVIEEQKEIKKSFKGTKKGILEDISELEGDVIDKQGDSSTADAKYEEERVKLQNDTAQDKQTLEEKLKIGKQTLDSATSKQIAGVQQEIDKGLQLRHGIENAIVGANKNRRLQIQGAIKGCRGEAARRLASYRAKRRASVKKGLNRVSALNMLKKNRVSLSSKDDVRFKKYYSQCWKEGKEMRAEIEKSYKQNINQINQKKTEAFYDLNRARQKAAKLNQAALAGKKKLVAEYTKSIQARVEKFNRDHQSKTQAYMAEKKQFTNELLKLQQDIQKKKGALNQKVHEYVGSKAQVAKMRKDNKRYEMYDKISLYATKFLEHERKCVLPKPLEGSAGRRQMSDSEMNDIQEAFGSR